MSPNIIRAEGWLKTLFRNILEDYPRLDAENLMQQLIFECGGGCFRKLLPIPKTISEVGNNKLNTFSLFWGNSLKWNK